MADCSYSRCIQERRNIRRELQKWTKNMVYVVGLERVAEELMGRRKWKLYQESISKSLHCTGSRNTTQLIQQPHLNNNNNNNVNNQINNNRITESTNDDAGDTTTIVDDDEKRTTTISGKLEERLRGIVTSSATTTTTGAVAEESDENNRLQPPPDEEHYPEVRDWSPSEKCLFCADGKLESHDSETSHLLGGAPGTSLSPQATDSESSESHSDTETPPQVPTAPTISSPSLNQLLQLQQAVAAAARTGDMTTIESVHSMTLAAVAALSHNATAMPPAGALPFYSPGILQPWYLTGLSRSFQQQQDRASSLATTDKMQPAPVAGCGAAAGGEQPLDLSSKAVSGPTAAALVHQQQQHLHHQQAVDACTNRLPTAMKVPSLDTKHIFKAKPRMSAVAGRRTYTEEELQAALRDIQSGKLGTRRAAVIYGIPRSTLRNKVYKLAMERERESHLLLAAAPVEDEPVDELSGAEEEKEVEKVLEKPLLSMDDILRCSASTGSLKNLLQKGQDGNWSNLEQTSVGPYIQSLLAASGNQKSDEVTAMLPELVRNMIAEDQNLKDKGEHLNNGTNERSLSRQSSVNSVIMRNDKIPPRKSGTPPELMETGTNDSQPQTSSDSPSNVILKIPSFKPTTSKNGGDLYRQSSVVFDPSQSPFGVVNPPSVVSNDSSSPPVMPPKGIMSLRDVIAKSISQKFQQNASGDSIAGAMKIASPGATDVDMKRSDRFTPPIGNISVIKNHQEQHSTNRPGFPLQPPKLQNAGQQSSVQHQQQQQQQQQQQGGKGTRPKRGKYRNYDRDSLVEAVRAVQRGEMSVHRAGSYYGVPHSTLEYKVKERHLMRPRKRDPKPQPTDDKQPTLPSKSQDPIRNPAAVVAAVDKNKPVTALLKPPQKFPPTSPNGIKMPMFDPNVVPPLGAYNPPPFPFWPHPSFHPLSMDYARSPTAPGFPPHSDQLFATQMMQRLQEESLRTHPNATTITSPSQTQTTTTLASVINSTLSQNAREMAESLYDGTGANGSFLDGIIRSSLEFGLPNNKGQEDKNLTPENMSNKALLDQLCRNSRLTPLPKSTAIQLDPHSSGDESSSYHSKKTLSPINFSKDFPETKVPNRESDSPLALNFSSSSTAGGKSPNKYLDERFQNKMNAVDIVELSNDSIDSMDDGGENRRKRKASSTADNNRSDEDRTSTAASPSPTSRIYVKPQFQEITKPENLKPEVLVRYSRIHDTISNDSADMGLSHNLNNDRNGINEAVDGRGAAANNCASANPGSEPAQD